MTRLKNLIAILVLFSTYLVNGQSVITTSSVLNGSAILASATPLTVTDPLYGILTDSNPLNDAYFTSTNVCSKIHFGFDDTVFDATKFSKVYRAVIDLSVTSYNRTDVPTTINNLTLEIKHDNASEALTLKDYVVHKISGAHKLSVIINSIKYYAITGTTPITIIPTQNSTYLKLTFETDRYYNVASTKLKLNAGLVTYNGLNANVTPTASTGYLTGNASELQIDWSILNNGNSPVEYELEWSWVDNYNTTLSTTLPKNEINYSESDFRRNSTRIQTKESSYRIPLVYNKGYLIYRVRPVGRFLSDISKNYYGSWTTELSENYLTVQNWPNVAEINIAHEKGNKNWQFQTSYAEDGKKKDVISYFDGSLRNRQTVTKVNTNNQTIVGEVVYDNQGRAAIEVLPTPVVSGELKYFKNLTLNEANNSFTHNDFDWDKSNIITCVPNRIGGMSKNSGASNYYSEFNPNQNGFQKFVPNANKYPFSQIEYTPDNTGRIRKKGGVGFDHQIGSGHEMTYFYSKPSQEELNRLFGYKVGNSNRYLKNMVVDPNKQVSISYIDPQGRTVATALAGDNPTSLVPLDFVANSPRLTLNILENNNPFATGTNGVLQDGIQFNSVLNITKDDVLKLAYNANLTNTFYQAECTNKKYPFLFKGAISLKDDCGFERIVGGPLNLTLGNFDLSGVAPATSSISLNNILTDNLSIGTYSISKKLILDQPTLESYANDYVQSIISTPGHPNPCEPTFSFGTSFSDENCNVSCSECEKSLGENYLSSADYVLFKNLFPQDESTLGDLSVREPYIVKMEVNYVYNALVELFPTVTFTIVGSNISNNSTDTVVQEQINFATVQLTSEFIRNLKSCRDLCNQTISICDSNYELLLSDVSPTGQYGSTEGLLSETPEDTTPDDGTPDSPTTAPAFNLDSLSVFDDKNGLIYEGTISLFTNPTPAADGSTPSTPASVNYSAASWRNPIPYYQDINGTEVWIPLVKVDDITYEPALLHNSYAVERPINSGNYFTHPEYLLNFEDFYANWDPNWATSLVVHHPEHHYYNYFTSLCNEKSDSPGLGEINTDTFDGKLRSIDQYDATARDLINGIYSTIGLANATSTSSNSIDPFYKINYPVEELPEYKSRLSLMKEALFHNYDGMKVNGVKLNLIATAFYFTKYANGLLPATDLNNFLSTYGTIGSSTPSAYIDNFLNGTQSPLLTLTPEQKDRFWANFVSYYVGMKEKTKTVFSHIYAKKYRGYNDCIGNPENTDTFQTVFLKQNDPLYNNFVTLFPLTNPIPPIINTNAWPVDVCNNTTIAYYKDKNKRFISADYGYNSGLPDNVIAAGVNTDTASSIFTETGKCPLIFDMENLLNGLIGNQDSVVNSNIVPPYTNTHSLIMNAPGIALSDMQYLTPKLYQALAPAVFNSAGDYISTSVEHITSSIVNPTTMNITVGSGQNIVLKIITPSNYANACNPGLAVPSWSNYLDNSGGFKITEFKNIYYVPGSYTSATPYKFRILAKIERLPLTVNNNCIIPEELIIEGTTNAPIGECQFDTDGSVLATNGETQTGSGCANKTRFANALVKLMNELIDLNQDNGQSIVVSADTYSYNGSIMPQILNAVDGNATSVLTSNSFSLQSSGTSFLLNFTPGVSLQPADKITAIQIGNQVDSNNLFLVTVYYIDFTHTLKSVSGTITYIDFGCVCKERVYIPKHKAEIALEKLINSIWQSSDYTPQLASVCNYISSCDGESIHNFETSHSDGLSTNQGLYFSFDKGGNCNFNLDVLIGGDKVQIETDFYEQVTNFTDFEIIQDLGGGKYRFRIKAHYNSYYFQVGTGFHPPQYPAGSRYVYGTVECLNIDCESLVDLKESMKTMLSDLIIQPTVNNGYEPAGYDVYSQSIPQDPTILPENSIGIKNYYANQTPAGSQIGFNFNKINNCGVTFTIPNTQLSDIVSLGTVNFNDTLTTFTVDVTKNDGTTVVASGVTSCLELNECYADVNIPCKTCIPTPLEVVSCSTAWNEFVTTFYNPTNNILNQAIITANFPDEVSNVSDLTFAGQYFCQANYAYISSYYLQYLRAFGLDDQASDIENPLFITLAEFGSTKLRYGYAGTDQAVRDYVQYISNQLDNPQGETKTWKEYIDTVYTVEHDICPPMPLIPTIPKITTTITEACDNFNLNVTATYTSQVLEAMIAQKKEKFKKEYINQAIAAVNETFTKEGFDGEYQYTLYYYDQAGNLIQTVPPQGVNRLATSTVINNAIDGVRTTNSSVEPTTSAGQTVLPDHKMQTQYKYNSLNQLVWQYTPDGDETRFAYDGLGRIIASQNAKQKELSVNKNIFSYTRYDGLGRIFEAGQLEGTGALLSINDNGKLVYSASGNIVPVDAIATTATPFPANIATTFKQVTRTKYDVPFSNSNQLFSNYSEDNSFKRVTSILYFDQILPATIETNYNNAIYYNYDVHGNVKEIVTDINDAILVAKNQNIKRVVYDYDLISGNVNTVTYQPNDNDEQFIHKYKYDADNRIVEVQTSRDNVIWEKEAKYDYYAHGPLAQTTIGDKKVQGLDYIYTLQGWLKGVNSEKIGYNFDAGGNGMVTNLNSNYVAQDAFGFALNYFKNDYKSIGSTLTPAIDKKVFSYTIDQLKSGGYDLYNGNIKEMATAILDEKQLFLPSQFNYYRYDQLNRISSMSSIAIFNDLLKPNISEVKSIKSNYTYDRNGNLKTLQRFAFNDANYSNLTLMDDLKYNYPNVNNNQLGHVTDAVADNIFTNIDLDNQKPGNYLYDKIGQLTRDEKEGLNISWRVDGKVDVVKKDNGQTISFKYDGLGNRLSKSVVEPNGKELITYYSRDAQGNVLSIYSYDKNDINNPNDDKFYLTENSIYGSSRLGTESVNLELQNNLKTKAPIANDIASTARASLIPVVTTNASPVLGGLIFNNQGNATSWENNYSKLNFNTNTGDPLTQEFTISSNFKINSIVDDRINNLVALHSNKVVQKRIGRRVFGSITYNSNVKVRIKKDANGAFIPVILIEDHNWKAVTPKGKKKKRYSITERSIKSFTLNHAIPENEWNFNFRCSYDDQTNSYVPYLELNGNIYTSKDFTIINHPLIRYNSEQYKAHNLPPFIPNINTLGAYYIDCGENDGTPIAESAIALQADICDFTYSIDKFMREEDDPKKEHIFLFDNNSNRVQNYNPANYVLSMNTGSTLHSEPSSYCGSGLLDSDGDGINDYTSGGLKLDNCPYTYNPGQEDVDHDGVGDVCDNCKTTVNSGQEDADQDGVGDVCDNCVNTFNPEQVDSDGDGRGNVCDNCPTMANANQLDSNNNGIGDVCEGIDQGNETVFTPYSSTTFSRMVGDKRYELSNHLGNVLSVITDRPLFGAKINTGIYTVLPDVISYNDYYPFGSLVPNRHGSSPAYRYGFNGKEKDDELKGEGNSYDFGSRVIYDPRVGRFISLDPRMRQFPHMSPYAYASNNPIYYEDQEGEGPIPFRFKEYLKKDSWYVTGFLAGLGDGVVETLDMAAGIGQASAAWSPFNPYAWTEGASKIRAEHIEMGQLVVKLFSDSDLRSKMYSSIKKELGVYIDQSTFQGTNAEAGYNHGKLVFDVLSSFIGVGEIKALVETGEFSKNALKVLQKSKTAIIRLLKPCGCFTAGTQVYTEEGYKNIEDIKVGDKVWAYNDKTGNLELKEVIDTFTRDFTQVYKIHFGSEVLEATNEHPFFIGGKWLKVDELKVGDNLTLYDGTTTPITKIEFVEGNFKVYNFTVDEFHTYYVSKQNVLVHNGMPCAVSYGKNILDKFKKHSREMIAAARKIGLELPKSPGKIATQMAFKDYIQKVVSEGQSFVSNYMTMGDVIWSKLGDSIVIRKLDGEFITHLSIDSAKGKELLKHFENVVSKSAQAVPLTH